MVKELVFQGGRVRIEKSQGIPVVPISDIARAVDYNNDTMKRMVRNDPILKNYMAVVTTAMIAGNGALVNRQVICLQKEGVIGLLIKLNSSRIQVSEKRLKVQAFQQWAIDTLRQALDNEQERPDIWLVRDLLAQTNALMTSISKMLENLPAAIGLLSDRIAKVEGNAAGSVKTLTAEKRPDDREPFIGDVLRYREPGDPCREYILVREFLVKHCFMDPDGWVLLPWLYMHFENFCQRECIYPLGRNSFYDELRKMLIGIGDIKERKAKLYITGIRLKQESRA